MDAKDYKLEWLRILSMIMVITIHVANYYCRILEASSGSIFFSAVFYNGLSRTAVPVFFMISGALALGKEYNDQKNIKKLKSMILVLIFWTGVYYFWNEYIRDEEVMLIHAAVKSLYQPIKAHLWYVYAYLGIMIVLPYISMIARGMNRKLENRFILLWLFFSGASYVLRHLLLLRQWDISVDNPIPIVQGTYYLGYFIAGHIIYKRLHGKVRESKRTRLYVLGYLFSILVLIFGTYAISLNQGYYYEFAYGYRNLFTITASCFLFAGIAGREESLREGSKKILDKLSKASLGVYLVHLIFLELLQKNIMLMNFHPLAGIPILVLVVFVFSYISVYLMQKVPIIQKFV